MPSQETPETTHAAGSFINSGNDRESVQRIDQDHAVTRELGPFPLPVEKIVRDTTPITSGSHARTTRREDREPQEPHLPKTEDTRPSFKSLLDRYQIRTAQVAKMAGVDLASAEALVTGHAVLVEHIDALLTALSTATGETWNRLTVGHLHIRTTMGGDTMGKQEHALPEEGTHEASDKPP